MKMHVSRRAVLAGGAALGVGALAAPHVRAQGKGGTLSIALSQHWVPAVDAVQRKIVADWAAKNNVTVNVDFIGSSGPSITVPAGEVRARSGHDLIELSMWQFAQYKTSLEPLDDVIAMLTKTHGPVIPGGEYALKHDGAWRGVPATQTHTKCMESRLDLWKQHCGVDLAELFPAGPRDQGRIDREWTYEKFLGHAKKLAAAGVPFAHPISGVSNADANEWIGPVFSSFGAEFITAEGHIAVNSDAVREALAFFKELAQYMPADIYSWDDAGNNRWLLSGRGAGIVNPPSVWAGALKDVPDIAKQLWHHDVPRGPKGRYRGLLVHGYGVWNFGKNKSAAKDLVLWLADKPQFARSTETSNGYDIPLIESYSDNPVWQEAGPPRGTIYNYPVRGDEKLVVCGYPAPADVASRFYSDKFLSNFVGRVTQAGNTINDTITWAESELQSYLR
jgi:ABC-type glycerol-3-phosphate transport system substrate-binding protein